MAKVEDAACELEVVSGKLGIKFDSLEDAIEQFKGNLTYGGLYRELNSKHGYEIFEKYRKLIKLE